MAGSGFFLGRVFFLAELWKIPIYLHAFNFIFGTMTIFQHDPERND